MKNISLQIKKFGKYKRLKDGTVKLVKKGSKLKLNKGEIVALEYSIESDSPLKTKVKTKRFFPDGNVKEQISNADNVGHWGALLIFENILELEEGKYSISVELPEYPHVKQISQEFEISLDNRGTLFGEIPNKMVTESKIEEFVKRNGIYLSEDYREFLLEENGISFQWWHLPEFESISKDNDFGEKINQLTDWDDWILGIYNISGLFNGYYYPLEEVELFTDLNTCFRHFCPIGFDARGDGLLLIANGKHKGKLAMYDHDTIGVIGDYNQVKNGEYESFGTKIKTRFKDLSTASTDELLGELEESGTVKVYDRTFNDLLSELKDRHSKAYQELKKQISS